MLDCGIVTRFVYHIERYAMIAGCLVIGYLPMEIDVVGQNKNLLYIVALNLTFLFTIFSVVKADTYHLPHQGADDE